MPRNRSEKRERCPTAIRYAEYHEQNTGIDFETDDTLWYEMPRGVRHRITHEKERRWGAQDLTERPYEDHWSANVAIIREFYCE